MPRLTIIHFAPTIKCFTLSSNLFPGKGQVGVVTIHERIVQLVSLLWCTGLDPGGSGQLWGCSPSVRPTSLQQLNVETSPLMMSNECMQSLSTLVSGQHRNCQF